MNNLCARKVTILLIFQSRLKPRVFESLRAYLLEMDANANANGGTNGKCITLMWLRYYWIA